MIYVAGSGPSSRGHRFAHVVTKKKAHWDYEHIVLPRMNWITPNMGTRAITWPLYGRKKHWEGYYGDYSEFKPSNGLQAVFVAIDMYNPKEITLIGFDNILDGAKSASHDWRSEFTCIESLVRIVDPRS